MSYRIKKAAPVPEARLQKAWKLANRLEREIARSRGMSPWGGGAERSKFEVFTGQWNALVLAIASEAKIYRAPEVVGLQTMLKKFWPQDNPAAVRQWWKVLHRRALELVHYIDAL